MIDRHEAVYAKLSQNLNTVFNHGTRIAVYGIGNAAFRVSEILRPHCEIVGYIDRDESLVGQELYGSRIITLESTKGANAILIAANSIYWITIYKRVREFAAANNISVYNTDGTLAKLPKVAEQAINPLFSVSANELLRQCEKYEVISFDVFDTLLLRKIAAAEYIFAACEIPIENFAYKRRQAQTEVFQKTGGVYTLAAVYEHMGLDISYADHELQTEAKFLTPRLEMRQLFQKLLNTGKRIVLVSDMYVPNQWLETQLQLHGFCGYEQLFLSNSAGAVKENGSLFQIVKDYAGTDSILHIGDSKDADIFAAKNAGLSACRVLSGDEMLCESSLAKLDAAAKTTPDRIALGLLQNKLFNSPFALNGTNGLAEIKTALDLGYIVFAPLTLAILGWLEKQVAKTKPSKILFAARDGYLLEKLWREMRAQNQNLPQGVYFPISRRLCAICSFFTEADILDSLSVPVFSGGIGTFFDMRLGIKYEGADQDRRIRSIDADIIALVKTKIPEILENSLVQRERYLKYIWTIVNGDEPIMLFDIGKFGSCQRLLQKICGRDFAGGYLHYDDTESNAHLAYNLSQAMFLKSEKTGYETIERRNPLIEAVLTEKKGTYYTIDSNEQFINDDVSSNAARWEGLSQIHAGIVCFMRDYTNLVNTPVSKEYAAKALDLISEYRISGEVAAILQFDDLFMGGGVKPAYL